MLSKRVIPCLDVHDGRTVKGINFVDLIDAGDPVEQAKLYNDLGADEICFLDISATNEGRKTLFNIVSKVAESCFIPLTVGGGIKNNVDINNLLKSGLQYFRSSMLVHILHNILVQISLEYFSAYVLQ